MSIESHEPDDEPNRPADGQTEDPTATPEARSPPPVAHVQTKREIEATLGDLGMTPRKRFGQHFLIDGNLMRRLVEVAEIGPEDLVLEVGAGTGGLTDLLALRAGQVVCVEIDRDLQGFLEERFDWADHVRIVSGDVLAGKHHINPEVVDALAAHPTGGARTVKLVANLPYQVATPLIMNLLVDHPVVSRLCFTVQAEVGERIATPPGGKNYGPLAIVTQTFGRVETICRIGPSSFWPRPKVDSVMMRIDAQPWDGPKEWDGLQQRDRPKEWDGLKQWDGPPCPSEVKPAGDAGHAAQEDGPACPSASVNVGRAFAALVRKTFDHRRKTLRAALGYVIDSAAVERAGSVVDLKRRPEALTVAEWHGVFAAVRGSH